jgi:RNA polymerase sigma-70 factor (ECF subfamily)
VEKEESAAADAAPLVFAPATGDNQSLAGTEFVMPGYDSFSDMMDRLRRRDDEAARTVFHRFTRRLTALARSRLDERIRQKVDAEDVLQSVYRSFFTRQRDGQLELQSWDNLWTVLTVITVRKCANQNQRYLAERRDVGREVALQLPDESPFSDLARDPAPDEVAVLTETIERLFGGLDERDCDIVSLHLQGYLVPEISSQVGWAERTVQRALDRARKRLHRLTDI